MAPGHYFWMARTTRITLGLATLLLAGCLKSFSDAPSIEVPEGSIQFVFDPSTLHYDFYDSTPPTMALQLSYLTGQPYAGSNCIALSPNSPTDTAGSFVFARTGLNLGRMLQTDHGVSDTAAFKLLSGHEGSKGTYVIRSSGAIAFTWQDWQQDPHYSRFFVDSANIRIIGDSIASDVVNADPTSKAIWSVRWVRGICN